MYRNRLKINIRYLYKTINWQTQQNEGMLRKNIKLKKTSCPTNEDTIINYYYYIGRLNHFFMAQV